MSIQGWFPLGLTGLISLLSRNSQESSSASEFESINSSALSLLYGPTLTSIDDYWKNRTLIIWTFVGKVMSLLFTMLSRFVIASLPRSKCLLISWLQSPSVVILEPKKIKSITASTFPHLKNKLGLSLEIGWIHTSNWKKYCVLGRDLKVFIQFMGSSSLMNSSF